MTCFSISPNRIRTAVTALALTVAVSAGAAAQDEYSSVTTIYGGPAVDQPPPGQRMGNPNATLPGTTPMPGTTAPQPLYGAPGYGASGYASPANPPAPSRPSANPDQGASGQSVGSSGIEAQDLPTQGSAGQAPQASPGGFPSSPSPSGSLAVPASASAVPGRDHVKILGQVPLNPTAPPGPPISDDDILGGPLTANHMAYSEAGKNAYLAGDYGEARHLFEEAANAGDANAAYAAGIMYERGQGGPMKLKDALRWYREAAAGGVVAAGPKASALEQRLASAAAKGVDPEAQLQRDLARERAYANAAPPAQAAKKPAAKHAEVKAPPPKSEAAKPAPAPKAQAEAKAPPPKPEAKAPPPPAAPKAAETAEVKPAPKPAAPEAPVEESKQASVSPTQPPPPAVAPETPDRAGAESQPSAPSVAPPSRNDQAAARSDPKAAFALAAKYADGRGVARNDAEAVKWYRAAADKGFAPAENNLGFMYAEGRGVKRDDKEAVKWYQAAADQNYAPAQTSLGMMYAQGRGVAQSDLDALSLYSQAAKAGYPPAKANLGKMYADGRGVPRDEKMAEFLLGAAKAKPATGSGIYVDASNME